MAIATKQEVLQALKESREKDEATWELTDMIQDYVDLRSEFDPDYDHGYINISNLADDDEDGSLDFHDEDGWITIEWKEYGRCGDYDYYTETFDIEDLWSDEWETKARAEAKEKKEREERERQRVAKRLAEQRERREREQLRALLKKYPDEAQNLRT